MNAGIRIQVISPGQAAGEHHHIEGFAHRLVQRRVRDKPGPARGRDRAITQAGSDDFDPRTAKKVDQGNRFKFFATVRQRNQDPAHWERAS